MITFKDHENKLKVKAYLNGVFIMDIENTKLNKENFKLSLKQLFDHYKIES